MQPTSVGEGPTTAQQSPPKLHLLPPATTEVPHLAHEQHLETTKDDDHVTTQGAADTDTVGDPSDASPRRCRTKRPPRRYVPETGKWH